MYNNHIIQKNGFIFSNRIFFYFNVLLFREQKKFQLKEEVLLNNRIKVGFNEKNHLHEFENMQKDFNKNLILICGTIEDELNLYHFIQK